MTSCNRIAEQPLSRRSEWSSQHAAADVGSWSVSWKLAVCTQYTSAAVLHVYSAQQESRAVCVLLCLPWPDLNIQLSYALVKALLQALYVYIHKYVSSTHEAVVLSLVRPQEGLLRVLRVDNAVYTDQHLNAMLFSVQARDCNHVAAEALVAQLCVLTALIALSLTPLPEAHSNACTSASHDPPDQCAETEAGC